MRIESGEKTLSGIPAIAMLVGIVLAAIFYKSVFWANPETDAGLQASLQEDVRRYLATSGTLAGIGSAEALLAKSSTSANAQLVRTSMEKLLKPQIKNIEVERKKLNIYCGDDRQYHVRVRYETDRENTVNLRYCFTGNKQWLRSSSFHLK